jgi:hypothetical protein
MKLERCRDQPSETLEEHYDQLVASDDPQSRAMGRAMIALIARLRQLDDSREVFGLTSHFQLCLLAQDTYRSPWYVKFIARDEHFVAIERRITDDDYERIEVSSLDAAVTEIVRAMDLTGGWPT